MRLTTGWVEAVHRRLDHRLICDDAAPLAVALSGGGDSVALLHLVADWARANGRRVLALTVDHGLSVDSAGWSLLAQDSARRLGADWEGLDWRGNKPAAGLPAAARSARHALLADAARAAGARVILMAHTAGDVAEGDWMRDQGAPIGRLKPWAPSPAWPQGRGLMLLRPLLDVSRSDLRAILIGRNAAWVEDPANADPRFHRARARAALAGDVGLSRTEPDRGRFDLACDPLNGVISGPWTSPWLGHAIVCASGGESLPAPDLVERMRARLSAGAGQVTLSGALVSRRGEDAVIARERGRRPCADLALPAGEPRVWDGRFEILTHQSGWWVGAAAGRRSRLGVADRSVLSRMDPSARPSHPVLFREGTPRPVLADPSVHIRCLVPDRLRLASGGARREDELETPPWRGPLHRPI